MSAKHTPEPWEVQRRPQGYYTVFLPNPGSSPNEAFYNGTWVADNLASENAERIVACVNALAGIENPSAVKAVIVASRSWVINHLNTCTGCSDCNWAFELRSALAKLEDR